MTTKKQDMALIGAGAAACAVCCAGPILGGLLAAIGLGTAAGVAVFGAAGLAIAAIGVLLVLARRRRRSTTCEPVGDQPVTVSQRR